MSVAGIVVGAAGAAAARGPIVTAGLAGLVAGAVSMALGEYVSVSSQRGSERALMAQERHELHDSPEEELEELTSLYRAKGLSEATARQVAVELTEHDTFRAHLDARLGIDPHDLVSPGRCTEATDSQHQPVGLQRYRPPRAIRRSTDGTQQVHRKTRATE